MTLLLVHFELREIEGLVETHQNGSVEIGIQVEGVARLLVFQLVAEEINQDADLGANLITDLRHVEFLQLLDVASVRRLVFVGQQGLSTETLHSDHVSFNTWLHGQTVVLHIFTGASKDSVQESLFRRKLGLAFGEILPTRMSPGLRKNQH